MTAKVLFIDIETSPNVADVWGLWGVNVGINQLHESTRMICLAAKWKGDKRTWFFSEWEHGTEGMLEALHNLLNEADIVVHYNGDKFDVPHINREFLQNEFPPPAPFRSVDILKAVKKKFRFPSNKLEYVSKAIGLEGKVQHTGHQLWTDVLAGDVKAQRLMKKYNIQDVVLLEKVHDIMLPWIPAYPNLNLYNEGKGCCPKCGSEALQKRGKVTTLVRAYQRLWCRDCGAWSRSNERLDGDDVRSVG